jgi:hypothetical protein
MGEISSGRAGGGNLGERDHLEGLGINGRIILRWILGSGLGGHGLE